MTNNEKFMSDEDFNSNGIKYIFAVYRNRWEAERQQDAQNSMCWCNNDIDRGRAQCVLMGMAKGAAVKYSHPVAVVYAEDGNGNRRILSTCAA